MKSYLPDHLDIELARAVQHMPPIDNSDVARARHGIAMMQKFMPPVDTSDVNIEDRLIPSFEPHSEHDIPVRIYRPSDATGTLPVMLFFHWGGFMLGNLETEHARCVMIARDADCVVVSVDYRLAPEHPFPAGAEDCYSILLWVVDQAAPLGVDISRLAVGGTSAGGGLAAALCLMSRDRGGPVIAFQFMGFPVTDHRMATESVSTFNNTPNWTYDATVNMWAYYLGSDSVETTSPYASPLNAKDLSQLPPAYIWTAEFDPLRDEGIQYATKLMSHGVSVELHNYAGTFHGFDQTPEAQIALRSQREQIAVIRSALGLRTVATLGQAQALLSYTMIHVPDVEQTVNWYRQIFDLKIKMMTDDYTYAEMSTGMTTLAFSDEQMERSKYGNFVPNRAAENPCGFHLAFTVNNVDNVHAAAVEAGATSINAPESQPWGGRVARIRDLNGVLVAIGGA